MTSLAKTLPYYCSTLRLLSPLIPIQVSRFAITIFATYQAEDVFTHKSTPRLQLRQQINNQYSLVLAPTLLYTQIRSPFNIGTIEQFGKLMASKQLQIGEVWDTNAAPGRLV